MMDMFYITETSACIIHLLFFLSITERSITERRRNEEAIQMSTKTETNRGMRQLQSSLIEIALVGLHAFIGKVKR